MRPERLSRRSIPGRVLPTAELACAMALAFATTTATAAAAPTPAVESKYQAVQPDPGWIELGDLAMLALERETLANQLAAYVANTLVASRRADRLIWARRFLGLALTLHPENPRAKSVDRALDSVTPLPAVESEHAPEVLGHLLYHRARQLRAGTASESAVARYFLAVAAYLHPGFEDAVYEHERNRLEDGSLNWARLSGEACTEIDR